MPLSNFSIIDDRMCINRLLFDNRIFIQHAVELNKAQSGTETPLPPHGLWLQVPNAVVPGKVGRR